MTVTERLGNFIYDLKFEDIPVEVITKAKVCLLHGIGVGLAGTKVNFGYVAANAVKDACPGREATLLLNGTKSSVLGAAFANGVLFHSRVQEDTHGTTHIGPIVIPTALSLAELTKCSGKELITAIIAGYEIAAAVGKDHTIDSTPRGFRASGIYGIFGAAATAAKILGLNREQTVNTLGFAAAFAGGTTEAFVAGTTEWRFEIGMAAQNGLLAALVAKNGGESAKTAMEGISGFYKAFAGRTDKAKDVGSHLGKVWEIMNVDLKPYPVCAFNQTPVSAMINLANRENLLPQDVVSIEIEMHDYEANYPGMAAKGPFSTVGGTLMSTPFCLALAIKDRDVTLEGLQRYDDPELNDLVSKTVVKGSSERKPLCCKIVVETVNGKKLVEEKNISSDEYRYSWNDEVELMKSISGQMNISPRQLDNLIDNIFKLEELEISTILVEEIFK